MIYVAVGSNLPDRFGAAPGAVCRGAVAALGGLAGLQVVGVSGWYVTAPVPASDQPDYVNGVVALEGRVAPAVLLGWLQGLEAEAGRVRGVANAARCLDLDIIDMDGMVRDAPDPVLPHPRAHERGFVLLPLRDVAPGWVHPRLLVSIDVLIGALPGSVSV